MDKKRFQQIFVTAATVTLFAPMVLQPLQVFAVVESQEMTESSDQVNPIKELLEDSPEKKDATNEKTTEESAETMDSSDKKADTVKTETEITAAFEVTPYMEGTGRVTVKFPKGTTAIQLKLASEDWSVGRIIRVDETSEATQIDLTADEFNRFAAPATLSFRRYEGENPVEEKQSAIQKYNQSIVNYESYIAGSGELVIYHPANTTDLQIQLKDDYSSNHIYNIQTGNTRTVVQLVDFQVYLFTLGKTTKIRHLMGSTIPSSWTEKIIKADPHRNERRMVRELFRTEAYDALVEGLLNEQITAAANAVNQMEASSVKTELQGLVTRAQEFFDAKVAVDGLFTDDTDRTLADGVGQTEIDEVKRIVDSLMNSTWKTEQYARIQKAQDLLTDEAGKEQEAQMSVDALFRSEIKDALADGVVQNQIDEATEKVTALQDGTKKTELTELILRAQNFFDAKGQVDALFTDDTDNELALGVDQAKIDAAKAVIDKLMDGSWKTEQTARIQKAQELLDQASEGEKEQEAQISVDALFRNSTKDALATGVTETQIDEAVEKVAALRDGEKKTELTGLVIRAQGFLAAKIEVDALFTDETDSELASGVDQAKINAAKVTTEGLMNGAWKAELTVRIQKAEALLNKGIGTITVDPFKLGTPNITGSYTGDVVKARLYVNDNLIVTGGTFASGQFTFYAVGRFNKNDKVELAGIDKFGNELDRKEVTFAQATGTITIDPYRLGTSEITGTYTGDTAKASLYVNDQLIVTGGNFSDGDFRFYAAGRFRAGDKVELAALDLAGNELDRKEVPILSASGTISPDKYKIGTANITGTYEGSIVKARLYVNGLQNVQGGTFENGHFTMYAYNRFSASDTVEVAGLDKDGKELDRKALEIE
ncbi:toxin Cry1Ac domain D-VI-related protein [Candidatus Enterococcus courvalinii]|uniref:Uncharacterized protein n=1 Tax=Candidatus Enterococcus courvalinii TaxID=2815329 RepID=A0ABS3HZP4_9ENTE|nr:immunoglobulin-like domain-containing protein [Enterococcus sp. MSG2901]MBO0481006.1 hypothetical protein [Enterococcus sp. MSG2901]